MCRSVRVVKLYVGMVYVCGQVCESCASYDVSVTDIPSVGVHVVVVLMCSVVCGGSCMCVWNVCCMWCVWFVYVCVGVVCVCGVVWCVWNVCYMRVCCMWCA